MGRVLGHLCYRKGRRAKREVQCNWLPEISLLQIDPRVQ